MANIKTDETNQPNMQEAIRNFSISKQDAVTNGQKMIDELDALDGAKDEVIRPALAVDALHKRYGVPKDPNEKTIPANVVIPVALATDVMRKVIDLLDHDKDEKISGDEMLNPPPSVVKSLEELKKTVPGSEYLK